FSVASMALFSVFCFFTTPSIDRSFSSYSLERVFSSLPKARICESMALMEFLNSFSPSIPIFGPMSYAAMIPPPKMWKEAYTMPPRTSTQIPHGIVVVVYLALLCGHFVGPVHDLPHGYHVLEQAVRIDPKFFVGIIKYSSHNY